MKRKSKKKKEKKKRSGKHRRRSRKNQKKGRRNANKKSTNKFARQNGPDDSTCMVNIGLAMDYEGNQVHRYTFQLYFGKIILTGIIINVTSS